MYKKIIFIVYLLTTGIVVFPQQMFNSPYTRYGLGEFIDNGIGMSPALGGTSMAIRSNQYINYLNPASYSAQDTLSLIFDFGLTGNLTKLESLEGKYTSKSMNFNNFVIGFPLTKWMGASIGLVPYSKTGYDIQIKNYLPPEDSTNVLYINHQGEGAINNFYFGTSFKIKKILSFGVNMSYLFGYIEQDRTVNVRPGTYTNYLGMISEQILGNSETVFREKTEVGDLKFTFGFQFSPTFFSKHNLVLGGIYENKTNINGSFASIIYNYNYYTTDTIFEYLNEDGIALPGKLGLGFSYKYNNKILVAFDYISQNWSEAVIFNTSNSMADYNSMRFGIQITPVPLTEISRAAYWKRINFRLGGHYTNTAVKINNNQVLDYGISFGIGIPWRSMNNLLTKTSFNIYYELGKRGIFKDGYVEETYNKFGIGLTLYDFWFVKYKLD